MEKTKMTCRNSHLTKQPYLSTDHSTSSYGNPVMIDPRTGLAYGPRDILVKSEDELMVEREWLAPGVAFPSRMARDVIADLLARGAWFDDPEMSALAAKFIA